MRERVVEGAMWRGRAGVGFDPTKPHHTHPACGRVRGELEDRPQLRAEGAELRRRRQGSRLRSRDELAELAHGGREVGASLIGTAHGRPRVGGLLSLLLLVTLDLVLGADEL
eukprot:473654-Prymnesium_polylepis.1